jgi:probable FeS assembly SUF system protein SufT
MAAEHTLDRAVAATAIPTGESALLPAGTKVQIVQTLGGNLTVRTDRGLWRIAREDSRALGGFASAEAGETAAAGAAAEFSEATVWDALKACYDPEIPVNIVDLGLVYDLDIRQSPGGGYVVTMKMTLTAPGCGMGPVIAEDARKRIAALPTVDAATVHIVWDPLWTPAMISDNGRKILGLE